MKVRTIIFVVLVGSALASVQAAPREEEHELDVTFTGVDNDCLTGLLKSTQKAVVATAHNCWQANKEPWPTVMYPVCLVWSYAVLAVETVQAYGECVRRG